MEAVSLWLFLPLLNAPLLPVRLGTEHDELNVSKTLQECSALEYLSRKTNNGAALYNP
jgi:hypothetical protein